MRRKPQITCNATPASLYCTASPAESGWWVSVCDCGAKLYDIVDEKKGYAGGGSYWPDGDDEVAKFVPCFSKL